MFKRKEVNYELVSDLDKIVSETISFKLHGKTHLIKPVSAKQFFKYAQALAELHSIEGQVPAKELIDHYHKMTSEIVPTITRDDIAKCNQPQVAGLFRLIIDTVTGYQKNKPIGEDEKKK